jgi:hypothetical protein
MAITTKHYETLSGPERFQLLIEAMARRDDVECDRLEDSCPKRVYRCDDADFRDRVRRAYSITVSVCLNMRAGLARIRMAETFKETSGHFACPSRRSRSRRTCAGGCRAARKQAVSLNPCRATEPS